MRGNKLFTFVVTTAMLLLCITLLSASAFSAELSVGKTEQVEISTSLFQDNNDIYTFTAPETQYYSFTIHNQSIRTNVGGDLGSGLLSSLISLKLSATDEFDEIMGGCTATRGKSATFTAKMQKGQTFTFAVAAKFLWVDASFALGHYQISVSEHSDMGGDSWDEAMDTDPNSSLVAAIDVKGDVDWFTFEAFEEESFYTFSLESIQAGELRFNIYEYVHGAGDTPLRNVASMSVWNNSSSSKNVELNPGSTYYYSISCYGKGGYVLNTSAVPDDGGTSFDDAGSVKLDTPYTLTFDGLNDKDYVEFVTGKDPAYYNIVANMPKSIGDRGIYLYDVDGELVTSAVQKSYSSETSRTVSVQLEPRSVYFLVFTGEKEGKYDFTVNKSTDEYAGTKDEASEIEIGREYSSSFDGVNDNDYVKFETTGELAYYNITAKLEKSLGDRGINLYDADGKQLSYSYSKGYYDAVNHNISVQLKPNTIYYLRIYANNSGKYSFTVNQNKDSFGDNMQSAGLIEFDKEYQTSFDGINDNDYMRFETTGELAYYNITAKLEKSLGERGINLYDADGKQLSYSSTKSYYDTVNHSISIQLKPNTVYYLRAYANNSGKYSFTVSVNSDSYPGKMDDAPFINIDTEYSTAFDGADDYDYMAFLTGNKGGYYRISANLDKSLGDRGIYVYDEDGNRLGYSSSRNYYDGARHTVFLRLKPNTIYYVGANASYSGKYTFNISAVDDPEPNTLAEAAPAHINTRYVRDLCEDNDADWYRLDIASALPNLKISVLNESCYRIYYKLINSRDVLVTEGGGYSTGKTYSSTVSLEPDTYYLCIYGKSGYYTLWLSTCTSAHSEYSVPEKKATCTSTGYTPGRLCGICGIIVSGCKTTPKTDHNFVNRKCSVCGAEDKCINHTPVSMPDSEPTCTQDGSGGGTECKVCKTVISQPKKIPATGHSFVGEFCEKCGAWENAVNSRSFADVPNDSRYKASVDYVVARQLFNGTSDNKFSPDLPMTRSMLVTVLWRYAGEPAVSKSVSFSDVPDGKWYTNAIKWAAGSGIVNGVDEHNFAPNANVTREQLITILYRYIEAQAPSRNVLLSIYSDGHNVSSWATDAMKWAIGNKVYETDGKKVYPKESASRGLVANMFYNLARFAEN